jgi:hypothetical protein
MAKALGITKSEIEARSGGYPTYGTEIGAPYLEVKAINAGRRPVTVSHLTIQTPNKKWLTQFQRLVGLPETQLPAVLSDGETASAYFLAGELEEGLYEEGFRTPVKVFPLAQDSLGKIHRGGAIRITPRQSSPPIPPRAFR